MARRGRRHACDLVAGGRAARRGLALSSVALALCLTSRGALAAAAPPAAWPRWEASGQLSLVAAGGAVALRAQAGGGRYLGRHLLELRGGASHVLAATALDLDAGYALHARVGELLAFARGGLGVRLEHIGGGGVRSRLAVVAGGGLKLPVLRAVALRLDLEYRYLGGAPGVASELAVLLGPALLW